jgi:hypothetical protein
MIDWKFTCRNKQKWLIIWATFGERLQSLSSCRGSGPRATKLFEKFSSHTPPPPRNTLLFPLPKLYFPPCEKSLKNIFGTFFCWYCNFFRKYVPNFFHMDKNVIFRGIKEFGCGVGVGGMSYNYMWMAWWLYSLVFWPRLYNCIH